MSNSATRQRWICLLISCRQVPLPPQVRLHQKIWVTSGASERPGYETWFVQHLTNFQRERNLMEWLMIWTMLIFFPQTCILLVRKLCCVWKQQSSDQDVYKGKKSYKETRFQNPQSCSWLVVREKSIWTPKSKSNTLTPKTFSQTCWPREIPHVINGIIFCLCSTSAISVPSIVKTTPHKTILAVWISTMNSRTGQKLNKLVQLSYNNWIVDMLTLSAEWKSQQCVKWPETLGKSVSGVDAQCMSHHALKILRFFRSLSSLLSLGVIVPWLSSLFRCTPHCGSSLSLRSSHSPPHVSYALWALLSDLFDFSLHFISFPIICLITLLFLLLDNFIFHDVVDKYPAYFRWGPWHPGRE